MTDDSGGDQQPEQKFENGHEFQSPPRDLTLARQTVVVKRNIATISGDCPANATGPACKGTLALTSGKLKVGRARYEVTRGQRATVRIKLTSAARKLIARKRRLKVTATAMWSLGSIEVQAPVTLKLPARRR